MKNILLSSLTTLALSCCSLQPVHAEEEQIVLSCYGSADEMQQGQAEIGETPIMTGLTEDGSLLVIYLNQETRHFTVLRQVEAHMCIVDFGTGARSFLGIPI